MPNIDSILSKGYFPRELPDPFTTTTFGSVIASNVSTLPSGFSNLNLHSKTAIHNLARRGTLRRKLGIPNPINYFQLTYCICQHWTELTRYATRSTISLTPPTDSAPKRAIVDIDKGFSERAPHRAVVRSNARYILQSDISRFYHSIYTHSIPWAMHGKSLAKTDSSDSLLGNKLDRLVRNAQDRQTLGIPIGPDTSLLIAEIILSNIDVGLAAQNVTNGFRIMDDYEFAFGTRAEAELSLGVLQELLNNYELALNPNKTHILELPLPIEDVGIPELRALKLSVTEHRSTQLSEIIYHFDRAFTLCKEDPEGTFLKYVISKFKKITVCGENWSYFENMLLQSAITEPGTLPNVVTSLLKYLDLGYGLNTGSIGNCFNEIIRQHSPLGHGSEVSWAIWGLIALRIPLNEKSASAVVLMNDSIVAILTLDANSKGLIPSGLDSTHYKTFMTKDDLYGEQWLLAYEANVKGWLPSTGTDDHVEVDECFNFLKTHGISFYDNTLTGHRRPELPTSPEGEDEY